MTGLEAPALGRGEALLGELEVGEDPERLAGPGELRLEPRGQGAEWRSAATGRPHEAKRRLEKLASLRRARGQAIGADEDLRLVTGESVALHRGGHSLLVLWTERAERMGQRHAERPLVELSLQRLAEPLCQGEPREDPAALPAAGLRDGGRAEPVLVTKGEDYPRLVHRRERARGPVGLEQRDALLRLAARLLDEDGHTLETHMAPACEALEAVDDLEGAVLGGHHAQRQRGERRQRRALAPPAAAQPLQARAHPAGGHPLQPRAARRHGGGARRQRGARRAHGASPWSTSIVGGPPSGTESTCQKPSLACA